MFFVTKKKYNKVRDELDFVTERYNSAIRSLEKLKQDYLEETDSLKESIKDLNKDYFEDIEMLNSEVTRLIQDNEYIERDYNNIIEELEELQDAYDMCIREKNKAEHKVQCLLEENDNLIRWINEHVTEQKTKEE